MATIDDLPALDSDVNVVVTAINVFGSGPASNVAVDEICELGYLHTYIRTYYKNVNIVYVTHTLLWTCCYLFVFIPTQTNLPPH